MHRLAVVSAMQARHTAAVVNELSAEIMKALEHHPVNMERAAQGLNVANVVLLRGCGSRYRTVQHRKTNLLCSMPYSAHTERLHTTLLPKPPLLVSLHP